MKDVVAFQDVKDVRQPFRLNFSTSKVVILVSVCPISKDSNSTKENIFIETYETSSVYNLAKSIHARSGIKFENIILYHSRKVMKLDKTLSQYGIHSMGEPDSQNWNFYNIKAIEKVYNKKNKLSIGLNSSFYKINSVRKVEWEQHAPWYREVHDGLNWIGNCK